MRKLLLAGITALMMAGPVLADDRDGRGDDRRDDRREWRDDRRDEWRDERRDDRSDYRRDVRDDRRDYWRDARDDRRDDRRDYRNDYRRDYRWSGNRYRGPAYMHPRGYGYRSWGVGYRVPQAYYGDRYWIGNPGQYRLPPAYRGTRWVRVGPDALLISRINGQVLQAVRGLYW
ncbi:hypothetical protein GCM10011529_26730 [Polymorphobacter glacialis]|uniref:RcnB family protein n=1 Tax=Sandarakinorhabdus glacialis TaxID=1614636 RepID=A0A917EAU4_9SPHN|nr:RcnB family protein [Polymorphobacter glacialis]GGE18897.1 hypothetical protein GCM10011529_26730 [Polymorphobacter glacialis]